MNYRPNNIAAVDKLIEALLKKLQSNREVLQKSPDYGRLIWRRKNGEIEIDLELKI